MVSLSDEILESIRDVQFQKDLLGFKEAQKITQQKISDSQSLTQNWFSSVSKDQSVKRRINRSATINQQRLRKISQRNQLCQKLFRQVRQNLTSIIRKDTQRYKLLLIQLIVSGVIRMFEPELYVRCLKEDEALVKEIIPDCIQAFHYKMEMELGRRYPLELRIDSSNHLKKWTDNNALLSKNEEMNFCIGGVIITNASKDIVYKNTLDCRLSILQEMSLPEVRYEIWRDRS